MLEHDAFEDRAQQVALAVPAGNPEEAAALMRAQPSAVEEGMEQGIVMRRGNAGDQLIDEAERIVVVAPALYQRRTYHSRLAADVALFSMLTKRPGP